jgi:hypothetical protein
MALPTLREGLRMPFSQFWPIYLDAHRHPVTRSCHYVATVIGATVSLFSVLEGELLIMAGGILAALCIAIASHKLIERNKPLVGVNPFYGAVADVKMCWLALRGSLAPEYIRLGLVPLSAPVAAVVPDH